MHTRHTFHVVGLPHTHTTADFPACAFTQKVVRFCRMMKALGHHVYLYAGEKNEAPCDLHLPCIPEEARAEMIGDGHYTQVPWGGEAWKPFLDTVVEVMEEHVQPRDFICLIGGAAHKPIADAFPSMLSVEIGIGYPGTFAKFRVFESYAWMHMVYGAETGGDAGAKDGHWFDAVIPNQVDEGLYGEKPMKMSSRLYALYAGRLIDRKGYKLAQDVCEEAKVPLYIVGPGAENGTGYGVFVKEMRAPHLVSLMRGARALFAPTHYVEPFGTVHIEAMAAGTPVITTDWGVFTETVVQGIDGFRCRTFKEFLDALRDAENLDPNLIKHRALARFSMDVVGRQYAAYFDRLSMLWGKGFYER